MTALASPSGHSVPKAARFWDKIAEKYSKKPVPDAAIYAEKLRRTQEHLRPDMTVLEMGCGTGSTALAHAPYVKEILATDISPKMLEIGAEKAAAQGIKNVRFQQAAVEDLDVDDASLDAVLGLSLLHLVDDWKGTIAAAHAMLKPGAVFVTSTPCLAGFFPGFATLMRIGHALGFIPKLQFFTLPELTASLRNAGFEIEAEWLPGKKTGVFIIARKPANSEG